MNPEIKEESMRRGITRLCHFTPSRNLVHIVSNDSAGILATSNLKKNERNVFNATDLKRLDKHEGYISCSIEYPNTWYFDIARSKDELFKDWVVLFIDPKYLWIADTRFCPFNAAAGNGGYVSKGMPAFLAMFSKRIITARGRSFTRSGEHLLCCPTDDQAEVLIPDQISLSDILGIAVSNEPQAKRENLRLQQAGGSKVKLNFVIAPELFDKRALSILIRLGKRPEEKPWSPRR